MSFILWLDKKTRNNCTSFYDCFCISSYEAKRVFLLRQIVLVITDDDNDDNDDDVDDDVEDDGDDNDDDDDDDDDIRPS